MYFCCKFVIFNLLVHMTICFVGLEAGVDSELEGFFFLTIIL